MTRNSRDEPLQRERSGRIKIAASLALGVIVLVPLFGIAIGLVWQDGDGTMPVRDVALSDSDDLSHPDDQVSLSAVSGIDYRDYVGRRLSPLIEKASPTGDTWVTEVLAEKATKQLKRLANSMEDATGLASTEMTLFATEDFGCGPLRPEVGQVYDGLAARIFRMPSNAAIGDTEGQGPSLLAQQLKSLRAALHTSVDASSSHAQVSATPDVKVHFKVFRIEQLADGRFTTSVNYQAVGHTVGGAVQQNATWVCQWQIGEPDQIARLSSIAVNEYEEVHPGNEGQIEFADWTASVLQRNESFHDQLRFGMDHWRNRLPRSFDLDFTGHHGIAVGDVNGDLMDDIYLCQPGGLPNRLYVRQPDGTLDDQSSQSGADWLDLSHGASLVDLDNDMDRDLVITQARRILVMENDGHGRFTRRFRANGPGLYFSIAAADYDRDQDLDLFVCGYSVSGVVGGRSESEYSVPAPYHDANNGVANVLFRNEGGWRFTDVTRAVGLDQNNRRFSFAASWEDYDNDGDLDLYVANDFGRNNLFEFDADAGRFTDVAPQARVEDISAGMSVTWGDFDRNGFMDAYISNMFSSAGGRVAYQRQFRSAFSSQTLSSFQRHARGNTLFQNLGDGRFADISMAAKVTMGRWAWGAKFADINNDQWDDLLVANGFITTDDQSDL